MIRNIIFSLLFLLGCKGPTQFSGAWIDPNICLSDEMFKFDLDSQKVTTLDGQKYQLVISKSESHLKSNTVRLIRKEINFSGDDILSWQVNPNEKRILINSNSIGTCQVIDKLDLVGRLWHEQQNSKEVFFEFLPNGKFVLTEINDGDTVSTINEWALFNVDKYSIIVLRTLTCTSLYVNEADSNKIYFSKYAKSSIVRESIVKKDLLKIDFNTSLFGRWDVVKSSSPYRAFDMIRIKESGEILIDEYVANWYIDRFGRVLITDISQKVIDNPTFQINHISSDNLKIENGGVIYELKRRM